MEPLGGRRGDQPAALIVLVLIPVTPRFRSNEFAFYLGWLVTLAVVGASMPAMGACATGLIIGQAADADQDQKNRSMSLTDFSRHAYTQRLGGPLGATMPVGGCTLI